MMTAQVTDWRPSPKQRLFLLSKAKYTAYGGARGGGKSWAIRVKACWGAMYYGGIRILIVRRTYPELRENHILPLLSMLSGGVASYNDSAKAFSFANGSRIKLGYCANDGDLAQYQGQEYDWIFIDEATQLTEMQFDIFKACLRGPNGIPKRVYLSCNPGGVGHAWVKRLFIDRDYREGEEPGEYYFIPARVFDNEALMKSDPGYVRNLRSLPSELRAAWLEGSWDVFAGQYFREFRRDIHVVEPFSIPPFWRRFRCLDYGLDTCCCLWLAVDGEGRVYVYRELHQPGLILSAAALKILELTPAEEEIRYTVASPDLWNKRQETGECGAEIMLRAGLGGLRPADHARVAGWRLLREYLQPVEDRYGEISPRLKIFSACPRLIASLPALTHDDKDPEDCAAEPHQYTHAPEALRYGLMSRPPLAKQEEAQPQLLPDQKYKERAPLLSGKVDMGRLFKNQILR